MEPNVIYLKAHLKSLYFVACKDELVVALLQGFVASSCLVVGEAFWV